MSVKRKRVSLSSFRNSTFQFRAEEEVSLNIKIVYTSDRNKIFELDPDKYKIEDDTKFLILDNYTESSILSYDPDNVIDENINVIQRRFIYYLKNVILNNNPDMNAPNCERYIDDLMNELLNVTGFNDCKELFLRPCQLQLQIGNQHFAAIADRECRRGTKLIWFLQEDKHERSRTYKHGDVQLACAMIAGYQQNYNRLEEIYPDKMVGIKAVADKLYFASMICSRDYLEELNNGLPTKSSVIIHLFPEKGLNLRSITERECILKYLTIMRLESLSINKK